MSIGAAIKKYNPDCSVKLVNGELMSGEEELISTIYEDNPDVVGISTNVGCYRSALSLAKRIKRDRKNVLIVLGGPYISTMWQECLRNRDYIDACVIGDGEMPMVEISKGVPLSDIAGVAIRDSFNQPYLREPVYYDLDDYPDPDWGLINAKVYQDAYREIYNRPHATVASINAQKGCQWREKTGGCIFCGLVRPSVRTRSPLRVWQEIELLNKTYGCDHFWELSDSICSNVSWLTEFSELKPATANYFFHGYGRASEITDVSVALLKKIGFREMFIGIESGDDEILKASTKGTTASTNLRATKTLAKHGINTFASIVLGLPGESVQSLQTTYAHVQKLFANGLYTLSVCVLTPYPGSKAFQLILEDKDIGPDYRGKDFFDWPFFAKLWVEKNCKCGFSDIMEMLDKYSKVPGCLYEDNFTYTDRVYDI
jgi:radical SAM superfamily enzyme YgiQ (UPF0313 family)